MTPIAKLYFSAFIIIGSELMLMMYIFMLQPKLRSNQLFAVYMLTLALSSYTILIVSTAVDVPIMYSASRIHALATLLAGPLLWLLVLNAFIPQHRVTRWLTVPLLLLILTILVVGATDWLTSVTWLFRFEPDLYVGGYVPLKQVLNGRFSGFFYAFYLSLLNSLLVIPIGWFSFSHMLPERLRRAARVLLFLSLSVVLLRVPGLPIVPALRNMVTPFFAAVGAAWVVSTYRFFSPMELAMKQVVDTVTIGLLVFDEELYLMDANAFSLELLSLNLNQDKGILSLPQLFQRLLPDVENKADLIQLQEAVKLKPEHGYQQEIVLGNGRYATATQQTWILFDIRPVYDTNHLFLGLSCSLEDLTVERRTQGYITEAHKTVEQYAYNQALLNDITQTAISANDFDASLSDLASRLVRLFEADHCYISLWDESKQISRPAVAYGEGTEPYLTIKREEGQPSISMTVYRERQVLAIEDLYNSPSVNAKVARLLPSHGMLALPMIANEKFVGSLLVGFKKPRLFTQEEIKWGEQIARQLTLALFKNRLLAAEREQRILLEALQAAGQALTSTLDFERVLDRILKEIARVIPYDTANFALVSKGEAYIVRRLGPGKPPLEETIDDPYLHLKIDQMPTLKKLYETRRPLRITNTYKSVDWVYQGDVKSWLGVPLVVVDTPIAFLMVDKFEADFYQTQHEEWLTAFASQATMALQNAQFFTEIQRRVTELEALSTVSAALRSSETVPVILQAVLQAMVGVLSARLGVVFMLDEAGTAVVSQASYPTASYPMGIRFLLGEGITGHVAKTGQVYVTKDLNSDPKMKPLLEESEAIGNLCATIALPLISEEGILGVIHLGLDKEYEFAEDEIRTFQAMSNIVANGLQRLQVMQTLEARVASRTYDLEKANERLQELDKLKNKFIADVTHELRTPVANLSIYINLLQHGNPEKQKQYIATLQQQANRLTNLVEATLGLSRLEIGAHNSDLQPVALNHIVEEILISHQARADAFNVQLVKQLQPSLPPVLGDQTQLVQVVTNLVANAMNYNIEGGQIQVETFVKNDKFVGLRVSDSGMGISEDEMPHLFDRFYRGQRTGQSNIPGTGLGLAIVKEIVDLHQGQIEVTSQIDEGTAFLVYLPIYTAPDTEPSSIEESFIELPGFSD